VDDEPVVLNVLAAVFDNDPLLEVIRCPDGTSALQAMAVGVDVLLTDKNLPDIGGLELARRVRDYQPDAEVIVITGYASLDTALAALELDVFDYIVKPPKDIYEVRRKVKQALDKQRMSRENRALMLTLQERNRELESALAELTEVQAELIQSEKLAGIGTLAAGIAHEISSPLFGVMGLAEAILEEDNGELVRGYAREIVEYSQSIKEIVVELTGYSRSAVSEYHTTVDLPRVLDDAIRLCTRSLSFDPDCISLTCEATDLYVNARTSEVQQVFVNLVKNAVEAVMDRYGADRSDAGRGAGAVSRPTSAQVRPPAVQFSGRVVVRAGRADRFVWATVTDNGAGIPKERQSAIFDPFYTTKPPGRGTGLGLNIVYRILTKYRGQISVESKEGEGTTFQVRFPTNDAQPGGAPD
jgi:C4-dicarboxylate-specific signal transduction histidine kinase